MKLSRIIFLIILIVIGIATYKTIENKSKSFNEQFGNNIGYISDVEELKNQAEKDKNQTQWKIVLISFGILSFLIIIYRVSKRIEAKNDPIKSLQYLKENSIISQNEFELKTELTKQKSKNDKEKKELISDLENLKNKEIISELEFEEKVNNINQQKQ